LFREKFVFSLRSDSVQEVCFEGECLPSLWGAINLNTESQCKQKRVENC
jgi:hypothetical protein